MPGDYATRAFGAQTSEEDFIRPRWLRQSQPIYRRARHATPPEVLANFDSFVLSLSARGFRVCGDQLYEPARCTFFWCPDVPKSNGVVFDREKQMGRLSGRILEECASGAKPELGILDASNFGPSLHQVAFRINASDFSTAGARRTARSSFLARSFFACFAKPHCVAAPPVGEMRIVEPGANESAQGNIAGEDEICSPTFDRKSDVPSVCLYGCPLKAKWRDGKTK